MIDKKTLNKDERNLLLFFETCLVDHNGKVATRHMNEIDFAIAKKWTDEGFVSFKRLPLAEVEDRLTYSLAYKVLFSEHAFDITHTLRKERALRHTNLVKYPKEEVES